MDETDDGWVVVKQDATGRVSCRAHLEADGSTTMVWRREETPAALLDQIKDESEAAEAKGWREGAVVGRVPLSVYFGQSGLAKAMKQHDTSYIRKWWNDPDHARLRIKKGRV